MSATGTPKPAIGEQIETSVDRDWFYGLIVRCKIAEEYVSFLDVELLPLEHALRQVIREDLPKVLRELARLRPDLL